VASANPENKLSLLEMIKKEEVAVGLETVKKEEVAVELREGSGWLDETRFRRELEFLSCLANPEYLQYLSDNRYFEDERFVRYLDYLQYWHTPPYRKYILFPHCLHFLQLLQESEFRKAFQSEPSFLHQLIVQQKLHWEVEGDKTRLRNHEARQRELAKSKS
jgi:mediator of RNA polymerase II transcription subunit 31